MARTELLRALAVGDRQASVVLAAARLFDELPDARATQYLDLILSGPSAAVVLTW